MVRYEVRRCGVGALAVPTGTAAALGVLLLALSSSWTGWLVGSVFPVAVGMAAAMVIAGEDALELHLTLPTAYPRTVRRRLVVLAVVSTAALAGLVGVLAAAGRVADPVAVLVTTGCFATLLFGTAVCVAVRAGSAGGASAVVLAVWLAKLLMLDGVLGRSGLGAVVVALAGAVLLAVAARLLDDEEILMKGASA